VEKSGGVFGEEGECGDDDVELLVRERRSLDILSVKKEACWIFGNCSRLTQPNPTQPIEIPRKYDPTQPMGEPNPRSCLVPTKYLRPSPQILKKDFERPFNTKH